MCVIRKEGTERQADFGFSRRRIGLTRRRRHTMKRYKVSVPRVTCAITALVMATIAICLGILPSMIESQSQMFVTMAETKASTTTQCDTAN